MRRGRSECRLLSDDVLHDLLNQVLPGLVLFFAYLLIPFLQMVALCHLIA